MPFQRKVWQRIKYRKQGSRACERFGHIALFLCPYREVMDLRDHERPPIRAEPEETS